MIKGFRNFIIEESDLNPVVFSYGRMNPPTTGHGKLVDKVKEVAAEHKAKHEIIVSHYQDPKKNPLSQEDKIKHAKRFFPGANIVGSSKEAPSLIHHAKRLYQAGHRHLIMVAGSDRVDEYKNLLSKYNGTHDKAEFNFHKIDVVSAGHRDPDAEGVEGMSASKMREHAANGNFEEFKKGVPQHVSDQHAKSLYDDVRKGLGVN